MSRTLPNPSFDTAAIDLFKAIIERTLPGVWRQIFVAPMAHHGDYDTFNINSKTIKGLKVQFWKDAIEVTHGTETYKVTFNTERPLHITGGWLWSTNWRTAEHIIPEVMDIILKHIVTTASAVGKF